MFGISTVTSLLECLIFMPISFTAFRFFMPPELAVLMSGALCLIALLACWLCKIKLKMFLYRIISVLVSISIALIVARVSLGAILIAAIYIIVFVRVRSEIDSGIDIATTISAIAIILNIPLALINIYNTSNSSTGYSNATIFISTIASVILLLLKQVDDSRRFGKNNMDISNTQRKNNRIFAGVLLCILLTVSSIGQVSNIYSLVINIFVRLVKILAYIFSPKSTGEMQQPQAQMPDIFGKQEVKDPSIFDIILQTILSVLSVIIIVALIGFAIYFIAKIIIKLILRIINWFKNGEQAVLMFSEDGHIDERQSLYNRNLKNMADKLRNIAESLFDRELPYNKLPNDLEKIRRLFKIYKNKAEQIGLNFDSSETAKEICLKVTNISPETKTFDAVISKCYDAARYDESIPSPQELSQLEDKLLK